MQRPTMSDIARACGVSKNTVSLALMGSREISEPTRDKVQSAARRMGYTRNAKVAELMAELRRSRDAPSRANLALINANAAPDAFKKHPTIPTYVDGIRKQAMAMGYHLDTYWIHHPEHRGSTLLRMFRARSIRGILLVGMMNENRIPDHFHPLVNALPCVVTGVRTTNPSLPFACVDHHILSLQAVAKAIQMGYRKPALVLDEIIDQLVEQRFSAGFRTGQEKLPVKQRVPHFLKVQKARKDLSHFHQWLNRHRPDIIFTLYNEIEEWVSTAGLRVPSDIALAQLEWRRKNNHWAGMNQHNEIVGQAAVDMLITLIHNNESGIPRFSNATLIGPTWIDGKTAPQKTATSHQLPA